MPKKRLGAEQIVTKLESEAEVAATRPSSATRPRSASSGTAARRAWASISTSVMAVGASCGRAPCR